MKNIYAEQVRVYDEFIFVDTVTGEGIDRVLAKIDPLLYGMASGTYLPGYDFEDIKQELTILAIDGIYAFDPKREVRLSTFLQGHLRNKFISKIRSENKMSNDAYVVDDRYTREGTSKIKRVREELNFSQCTPVNKDNEMIPFEYSVADDDGMYGRKRVNYESINFQISLQKLLGKVDSKTAEIIKLIYFQDYTIKDAAEKVGLSGWAASMRLKNLSTKKSFKDIFDKLEK